MKSLAKKNDKAASSAAMTRPHRENSPLPIQQKAKENDVQLLSRIISSGTPVNAYSPPDDSRKNSATSHLARLIQNRKIQSRLTIGKPDDRYEQEADQVADRVMRMGDPQIRPKPT